MDAEPDRNGGRAIPVRWTACLPKCHRPCMGRSSASCGAWASRSAPATRWRSSGPQRRRSPWKLVSPASSAKFEPSSAPPSNQVTYWSWSKQAPQRASTRRSTRPACQRAGARAAARASWSPASSRIGDRDPAATGAGWRASSKSASSVEPSGWAGDGSTSRPIAAVAARTSNSSRSTTRCERSGGRSNAAGPPNFLRDDVVSVRVPIVFGLKITPATPALDEEKSRWHRRPPPSRSPTVTAG
jgi:hypothetical protein